MPTIQARGLTKRFGANVLAVDHLDFDALPGGVTGFLGPNGAGKTTTLRMLLGLVRPTSGSVHIDGHDYRDLPNPTMLVGAVLEASGFHPARTARNHLRVIATMAGIPFSRVDECLELVGLSEAGDRAVGGFSMGMRQRLDLARALLGKPDILILDEPANGLDPQGIAWLRDFLRWYASEEADHSGGGRIVIVSSHLLSEAQLIVDDVIVLAGGRLAGSGKAAGPARRDQADRTRAHARRRAPSSQALRAANLPAAMRDGYVVCDGGTPEAVGPIMVENRIEVHEMVIVDRIARVSLLRADRAARGCTPGTRPGLMGDYRQFTDGPPRGARRLRRRSADRDDPAAQGRDTQALDDLVDVSSSSASWSCSTSRSASVSPSPRAGGEAAGRASCPTARPSGSPTSSPCSTTLGSSRSCSACSSSPVSTGTRP